MVPPYSHRVSRVRRYSGYSSLTSNFAYVTLTLFRRPSHAVLLSVVNAKRCPNPGSITTSVWPLPLSLATTRGISVDFSSSPYLDVSVQAVSPPAPMDSVRDTQACPCVDCSIRKSADQCLLTAPRSFSQFVASFFGSQCQGIPLALFVA